MSYESQIKKVARSKAKGTGVFKRRKVRKDKGIKRGRRRSTLRAKKATQGKSVKVGNSLGKRAGAK